MNKGRIVQVIGAVVDVHFPDELPAIYNALKITIDREGQPVELIAEVQQHLGDDKVRAVAMDATDGLARGAEVVDTGAPITVPVGPATLGRIFNVMGQPIDHLEAGLDEAERWPIHRPAPAFESARPDRRDLRDGHQGRRPAGALRQGRQDRPVRRRRRRQDRHHPGADPQHRHGARRLLGVLPASASAPARATTSGSR